MSRARELIIRLDEKHDLAVVQYKLPEPEAKKIKKLTTMFSEDQLDPNEAESQNYDPHVTIFYGLKDEDLPLVRKGLKNFGPLEYTIEAKPKIFDNPKHDVLMLPVQSDCFTRLHNHIKECTGREPPTFKEYNPHCTILYLKKGTPYEHARLSSNIDGKTNAVQFSDTQDKQHRIMLR